MQQATFIGVDLAWQSDKNPSGLAVAVGDRTSARVMETEHSVRGLDAVLRFIVSHMTERTVVAVDAPLIIRNATGQRHCEREIGRRFGGRKASAHTSNLTRYPNAGSVRLENALRELGFVHPAPTLETPGDCRRVMLEVYPHPAMIVLFGLSERILYKKGRVQQKRRGLATLSALLQGRLPGATPGLRGIAPVMKDPYQLKGRGLKAYEDMLDALFCCFLALHYWSQGAAGNEMFGDTDTGYILVPTRSLAAHPAVR